ncbi:hypothetical protein EDD37DRAFT_697157 [Exophiala viscosa]|uniref:FAD/NAD(P)-binding domain-containing protein n=1 Tax=Exophiala viscosa TaxID=2486360 RepID=A0AAN6DQM1_9EURO|nr:hypothetical protein EDD36DRAFT_478165 [Exophiala viscosa]KAI1620831.1 hypothetical protein EDD37DRAFT_697157 [Exophiala viscosa]
MASPTRVIIIGAGWSGLAVAKTYLQVANTLNRPIHLTILEEGETEGGVWSAERIYPGLVAEVHNGFYEFSDLSMVDEDHPALELIRGSRVHQYLGTYSKTFHIQPRIRFGVKVVNTRRLHQGGWRITTKTGEELECDKLVVATGLFTKPKVPDVPQSTYTGCSIHAKFLGRYHEKLIADRNVKNVVVVGGCKSAVDTCSLFLSAGKTVSWIVRPSTHGVSLCHIDPNQRPNLIAAENVRLFSRFSPSIFSTSDIGYRFLHSGNNALGDKTRKAFWKKLTKMTQNPIHYDQSVNGRKLQPAVSDGFHELPYASIVYKDALFMKCLHQDDPERLQVYRATPIRLQEREMIVQEEGKELAVKADAAIWCTGWQPSADFFSTNDALRLGMPVSVDDEKAPEVFSEEWQRQHTKDQEVLSLFPQLRDNPFPPREPRWSQPRMYHQILSPELIAQEDRSIAFVGFVSTIQTAMSCELQALWAVAWMEDLLAKDAIPDLPSMQESVSTVNAWSRNRYGLRDTKHPELIFESQSFFDVLCKDLGVEKWRKWRKWKGAKWWQKPKRFAQEWLTPYRASDYKGLVDEFLENRGLSIEPTQMVEAKTKAVHVSVEEVYCKSDGSSSGSSVCL